MLRLLEERSLFEISVERLRDLFPYERIFVVTVREQADDLRRLCPEIPDENFLIEPMPKGTASVVGLAAVALKQTDPQAVMAILTSDHHIGNVQGFIDLLRGAYNVAEDGYLTTLGITPDFASTGYGYIQRGKPLGVYEGLNAYEVTRFKEKPDKPQAREMLAAGDHSWNSGMFVWRIDRIRSEIDHQMPALASGLVEIEASWGKRSQGQVIKDVWAGLENQTIDYGIMEGAQRSAVIPAEGIGWSDVGSWDSLFDVLPGDAQGNIVMGQQHIGLDTNDSLIYITSGDRLIVTIGIEDLVVVDTDDVLLVCHKAQAQKVREIVSELKKSGKDYL
jgi:mannose-1-phosphate guanylyltransferase